MRFAAVSLICLSLFTTGCLSEKQEKTETKFLKGGADQTVTKQHIQFFSDEDLDEEHGWNEKAIHHFAQFQSVLSTDIEKARAAATKIAIARFGEHALRDEWAEHFFSLGAKDGVSLLDMRDYCELELQLLIDTDSTKYAKGIKAVQGALNQFNAMIKAFEEQGQDPSKAMGEASFGD